MSIDSTKNISATFTSNADAATQQRQRPAPFSLRLTAEERDMLREAAGSRPMGSYIRERLFGDKVAERRVSRRPRVDDEKLAHVLAELGRSRLSANINQLAKSANMGTLPLSDAVMLDLKHACADIRHMRETLIEALGLKSESG